MESDGISGSPTPALVLIAVVIVGVVFGFAVDEAAAHLGLRRLRSSLGRATTR
jgi:hypothetical protein